MPQKFLLGTSNQGKQKEMRALFTCEMLSLCTPQDISLEISIAETGDTYAENALIKAKAYCAASGLPALADDTGLEVDALDGAPGLFSARFSPKPGATDADRRALLIQRLKNHPQPWPARFMCAMALALPDGHTFITDGICAGEIIAQERGETGFGYDRIFLVAGENQTMAELGMEQKNHISHRARAAIEMMEVIRPIIS